MSEADDIIITFERKAFARYAAVHIGDKDFHRGDEAGLAIEGEEVLTTPAQVAILTAILDDFRDIVVRIDSMGQMSASLGG